MAAHRSVRSGLWGVVVALLLWSAGCAGSAPRDTQPGTSAIEGRAGAGVAASSGDTLRGTASDDVLVGSEEKDLISGAAGEDRLVGRAGDDVLRGEDGPDLLEGGAGSDILEGGAGDDILRGGAGVDYLFGEGGDDALDGGEDADVMEGGEGDDALDGGAGDDTMDGVEGDDVLSGGPGADLMDGGDGRDILTGGDGADDLDGGDEEDLLRGDGGDDVLHGGDGDDYVEGGDGDDIVFGADGNDVVLGGAGNDDVGGGDGDDVLSGGPNDDLLNGGSGSDRVAGGAGNDVLLGGGGGDVLVGEGGADRLRGGAGGDRLDGGADADRLDPGLDTDQALGGPGDDVVVLVVGGVGEEATEVVDGGPGVDTLSLNGFGPLDPSAVERSPPLPEDSTSLPRLAFDLTDPVTGGRYAVRDVEVVRHVTRLPVSDGTSATRIWIGNPGLDGPVGVEVVFLATADPDPGASPTQRVLGDAPGAVRGGRPAPDTSGVAAGRASRLSLSVPPGGVREVTADALEMDGRRGAVRLLASGPVAAFLTGSLEGGRVGLAPSDRVAGALMPVRMDREEGVSTVLALSSDGVDRLVQVALFNEAGGEVHSREAAILEDGATVLSLAELFPRASEFQGSARIFGGPLEGATFVTVRGMSDGRTLPLQEVGRAEGPGEVVVLPAVQLPGGRSELVLVDAQPEGSEGSRGRIDFVTAGGVPAMVELESRGTGSSLPFVLDQAASTRISLPDVDEALTVRIRVDSGSVAAMADQESSFGSARRPASRLRTRATALLPGDGAGTWLALHSPDEPARVGVILRDVEGEERARVSIELPSDGTWAGKVADLLGLEGTEAGLLEISSGTPVGAALVWAPRTRGPGFSIPIR